MMDILEPLVPYLPFFLVFVWGLYRMLLKIGYRLLSNPLQEKKGTAEKSDD